MSLTEQIFFFISKEKTLKKYDSIGIVSCLPLYLAPKERVYFMQCNCEYSVKGDNVIEARKLKLNLYFNLFKRAEDQMAIEQAAVE